MTEGAGSTATLLQCPDLGVPQLYRGKVREMFDLGDRLLMVATDRLSAFDVVFPTGIPGKGRVLAQISGLWFAATRSLVKNHLVTMDLTTIPVRAECRSLLDGRSMVVQRARRIDVECVVRGYLAGSAWKEYRQGQAAGGVALPPGLQLNSRLPEPAFTPALKNDVGHDENVDFPRVADQYGLETATRLRDLSLAIYQFASQRLVGSGLMLADTKFEFGWIDGEICLIDELLTPDSSRYWPADRYQVGAPIDSLDKQPIRDWAETSGWNKEPPAPPLPPDLVAATAARYLDLQRRLEQALGMGAD